MDRSLPAKVSVKLGIIFVVLACAALKCFEMVDDNQKDYPSQIVLHNIFNSSFKIDLSISKLKNVYI